MRGLFSFVIVIALLFASVVMVAPVMAAPNSGSTVSSSGSFYTYLGSGTTAPSFYRVSIDNVTIPSDFIALNGSLYLPQNPGSAALELTAGGSIDVIIPSLVEGVNTFSISNIAPGSYSLSISSFISYDGAGNLSSNGNTLVPYSLVYSIVTPPVYVLNVVVNGVSSTSSYVNGSVVPLSVSVPSGFGFRDWVGVGAGSYSGVNESASVVMLSNITESAVLSPVIPYSLTIVVNSAPTTIVLNNGSVYQLSVSPSSIATGYSFARWVGVGAGSYSGVNESASVVMLSNITESAVFNSPSFVWRIEHYVGSVVSSFGSVFSSLGSVFSSLGIPFGVLVLMGAITLLAGAISIMIDVNAVHLKYLALLLLSFAGIMFLYLPGLVLSPSLASESIPVLWLRGGFLWQALESSPAFWIDYMIPALPALVMGSVFALKYVRNRVSALPASIDTSGLFPLAVLSGVLFAAITYTAPFFESVSIPAVFTVIGAIMVYLFIRPSVPAGVHVKRKVLPLVILLTALTVYLGVLFGGLDHWPTSLYLLPRDYGLGFIGFTIVILLMVYRKRGAAKSAPMFMARLFTSYFGVVLNVLLLPTGNWVLVFAVNASLAAPTIIYFHRWIQSKFWVLIAVVFALFGILFFFISLITALYSLFTAKSFASLSAPKVRNKAERAAVAVETGSYCSQCGAPLLASDKFCQKCGAPVGGSSDAAS